MDLSKRIITLYFDGDFLKLRRIIDVDLNDLSEFADQIIDFMNKDMSDDVILERNFYRQARIEEQFQGITRLNEADVYSGYPLESIRKTGPNTYTIHFDIPWRYRQDHYFLILYVPRNI